MAGDDQRRAYWQTLESSPLREVFIPSELDHLVSVLPRRLRQDTWGGSVPVNPGGTGYGRHKQRARTVSLDTVELYVADMARRINPDRDPYALAVASQSKVRKARQRVRQLPTL
jgi:hypothetical protein